LGVGNKTVAAQRKELETTEEIPQLEKTQGADGKERPRKKQTLISEYTPPEEKPSTAQAAKDAKGLNPVNGDEYSADYKKRKCNGQAMQVNVEMSGRTETLDECKCAGLRLGAFQSGLFNQKS